MRDGFPPPDVRQRSGNLVSDSAGDRWPRFTISGRSGFGDYGPVGAWRPPPMISLPASIASRRCLSRSAVARRRSPIPPVHPQEHPACQSSAHVSPARSLRHGRRLSDLARSCRSFGHVPIRERSRAPASASPGSTLRRQLRATTLALRQRSGYHVTASRRPLTFDCRGLRLCVSMEDGRSLSRRRGGAVLSWGVGRSPPRPTVSVLAVNDGTPPPDREPRSVISALTGDRSTAMSAPGRVVVVVSCPPYARIWPDPRRRGTKRWPRYLSR